MTQDFPAIHCEKVDLATFAKGAQVVALSSPSAGEGVSTIAEQLAKRSTEIGKKTLLLLFSNKPEKPGVIPWKIGENSNKSLKRNEQGYYFLHVKAIDSDILKWADPITISNFFKVLKRNFDRIIVDLPPISTREALEVSPVPIAAETDCLMLITLSGHLTAISAKELVTTLEQADVKIAGVLLNDRDYPTIGMELARQADKLKNFAPALMANLAMKARQSEFLNVHI
jgi:hypothetical protein